ncbi:HAD family hydrolase [Parachlamydia acanthamoebae]|jgi:FMN phosphatase YigB (HAD superfamily)|uniref:Alpha-D-glucose-1-phosphate phosphatase YihX n=1 Tax=Parachlamydia acanthamoebae (strain UV7) TaxID=765952 RepID=F8L1B7_PARAV|nr:HAD family phosphatase [Parachlamydia acanthamoebae]CCB87049.1 putative uncharacterized protein [Parachlamydia acanthamoebae UV-7]
MQKQEYEIVIFDLGRVLFNWNPYQSAQDLIQSDPSFDLAIYTITQTPFWNLFDLGYISSKEMIEYFSEKFPSHHLSLFFEKVKEDLTIIDFGLEVLEKAQKKGCRTYILSNLSGEFHEWLTHKYPFLQTFNGAVFSYQIHKMKPDFQIYRYLLDKYQLNPQNCLFIDDLEVNVFSAEKVGIDSILFEINDKIKEQLILKGLG